MPLITTTVCSLCGKKTCDGGIWRYVRMVRFGIIRNSWGGIESYTGNDIDVDLTKFNVERMENCTLYWGVRNRKLLKGRKVGDEVRLEFKNWSEPTWVIMKKIED